MGLKAKSNFFSFLKAVFFVALCFVVSMAVIFPLWAFAKNAPNAYSVTVLVLVAAFALWKIALWAKGAGAKKVLKVALKCVVVAAGFFACVALLSGFHRIFALVAAILAAALFKLVDVAFKKA